MHPDESMVGLVDAYYRKNIVALRRKFGLRYRNLGQALVNEAIQQAFVKLLDRHRREPLNVNTLEALHALVFVTVSRLLIDSWRTAQSDRVKREGSAESTAAQNEREGFWTAAGVDETEAAPVKRRQWVDRKQEDVEVMIGEASDTAEFLVKLASKLTEKQRTALKMLEMGYTPAEIGAEFQQNGHVLVRAVRGRLCEAMAELRAAGDLEAARLEPLLCGG